MGNGASRQRSDRHGIGDSRREREDEGEREQKQEGSDDEEREQRRLVSDQEDQERRVDIVMAAPPKRRGPYTSIADIYTRNATQEDETEQETAKRKRRITTATKAFEKRQRRNAPAVTMVEQPSVIGEMAVALSIGVGQQPPPVRRRVRQYQSVADVEATYGTSPGGTETVDEMVKRLQKLQGALKRFHARKPPPPSDVVVADLAVRLDAVNCLDGVDGEAARSHRSVVVERREEVGQPSEEVQGASDGAALISVDEARRIRLRKAATARQQRYRAAKRASEAANAAASRTTEEEPPRQGEQERSAIQRQEHRVAMREQVRAAVRQQNTAARRRARQQPPRPRCIGLSTTHDFREVTMVVGIDIVDGRHRLPPMDFECPYCHAVDWRARSRPVNTRCCKNGEISFPAFDIPEEIRALFRDPEFRKNIRKFNLVFQFTSSGADVDQRLASSEAGVYTYTAHGRIYHRMGYLLPQSEDHHPLFAQIYVYDGDMAAQLTARIAMQPEFGLDSSALVKLHTFLAANNPYVQIFQTAGELLRQNPARQLNLVLRGTRDADVTIERTRNMPTTNEVAAIIVDDEYAANGREIVVRAKPRVNPVTGEQDSPQALQFISEFSDSYDPLHYPLIYMRGERGWTYNPGDGMRETCRRHARYQLYNRPGEYNHLLMCGRLLQEWLVDQYAKIVSNDLKYIYHNQRKIRSDLYHHALDLFHRDHEVVIGPAQINSTGRFTIVPATVVGSPRYMRKLYQDAMAMVRTLGTPDAFVTVTCNPTWPEIVDELLPGQTADDRPELVARVFKKKLDAILEDILVKESFGKVLAYMYTIEYQKRSLPHAHILLIFHPDFKPKDARDIDRFVSAEIPDPRVNPRLYHTVRRCMLHGPCGKHNPNAPCMDPVTKRCTKRYPMVFREATTVENHSVKYKRSKRGAVIIGRTGPSPFEHYDNFNGGYGTAVDPTTTTTTEGEEEGGVNGEGSDSGEDEDEQGEEYYVCDDATYAAMVAEAEAAERQAAGPGASTGRQSGGLRGFQFDNRWVVPYNPYLSSKFDCHINFEITVKERAVKYIFKYIYKGSDKIDAALQRSNGADPHRFDEIRKYQDSMYICATEAAWRIFSFPMHDRSHVVVALQVHIEGEHTITYSGLDNAETIQARGETTLTQFFAVNARDEAAREILYSDFPRYYVWANKQWRTRQRGGDLAIGRMNSCSLYDTERYFMRLLLCYRRGPTSFADLRTIDGQLYQTYAEAARAARYVVEDGECDNCMKEAASWKMPKQLRQLFAMLLVHRNPLTPAELWNSYIVDLSEDFGDHNQGVVMYKVLMQINDFLVGMGRQLSQFRMLPQISDYYEFAGQDVRLEDHMLNRLVEIERAYDVAELDETVSRVGQFNEDQRVVYETIIEAVNNEHQMWGKMFFLDGPGGTGKSFVLDTILAKVRKEGKVAIAVASSGIAALLLKGGRTAHSRFKIPLKVHSLSTCFIIEQTPDAELIKAASIIVWDEAPMAHKHAIEAVDRTLRDLMKLPNIPFGGKVLLMAGDFRQILPVINRGTRAQTVKACIKRSKLWQYFKTLRLTINMRLLTAANPDDAAAMAKFQEYQLAIGEGRHPPCPLPTVDPSFAQIPEDMMLENPPAGVSGMTHIVNYIYGDIEARFDDPDYFAERAILTPLNADVQDINDIVIDMIPLQEPSLERVYKSIDTVNEGDDMPGEMYPTEYLNTLKVSGLPAHELRLRVGATVMLMRNISGDEGLCNGTRMRVMGLGDNCIDVMTLTGSHKGNRVMIMRMELSSSGEDYPFELLRVQFPVQLAFAMTINKAQGQSVANLGLFLPHSVFSHGQLYVAISRVTSRASIKVTIENPVHEDDEGTYTQNVVYKEIFLEGRGIGRRR